MQDTIPRILRDLVAAQPDRPAQLSKDAQGDFQPVSFRELYRAAQSFAAGLRALGVQRGDRVGLLADNRKEWLVADLAIQSLGAADVPRGCDTLPPEAAYIYGFSACKLIVVENEAQCSKLLAVRDRLGDLAAIVCMDALPQDQSAWKKAGITLYHFSEVSENGAKVLQADAQLIEREIDLGKGDDCITIIFTSGTTGEPKGVMLSHRNYIHQLLGIPYLLTLKNTDIWLCILPVWHSFERIMQYVALSSGSALAYSKPIGKIMLADLAKVRPTWMASVPRIWESIQAGVMRNINQEGGVKKALFTFFLTIAGAHSQATQLVRGLLPRFKKRNRVLDFILGILPFLLLFPLRALGDVLVFSKIRAKLGGRFIAGISGGGALPPSVDRFFMAANILLLEGYGLTETAPVLGVRAQHHPVSGTVGPVFPNTEIKIVDDHGTALPPGHKGLIMARGPQVMLGYYKKPELTASIIDKDGWINTGDLGMLTWDNELKITGRAKDTIVLMGGENVEPSPIEQTLVQSEYITQAVVLGQDQKFLAALIVPDFERLEQFAKDNSLAWLDGDGLLALPEVQDIVDSEIRRLVNPSTGYRGFEMIFRFALLPKPFEIGVELSAKQEIKRHVIAEKYRTVIEGLFR